MGSVYSHASLPPGLYEELITEAMEALPSG